MLTMFARSRGLSQITISCSLLIGSLTAQDQYRSAILKTPFPDSVPLASFARSVDWNSDGSDDIALFANIPLFSTTSALTILLNDGEGHFSETVEFPLIPLSVDGEFADVNGDGLPDLIRYDGATAFVSLRSGSGLAPEVALGTTIGSPSELEIGDLNGDGDPDVVLGRTVGDIRWAEGLGGGSFAPLSGLISTGDPSLGIRDLRLEDLEGDGDLDIIAGTGPNLHTWQNDGTASFAPRVTLALGSDRRIRSGDFDGDGDLDRVVEFPGQTIGFFRNDLGSFVDTGIRISLGSGSSLIEVQAADFDGDGETDVFATPSGSLEAVVLRSTGSFTFDAPVAIRNPGAANAQVLDADQDSAADLAFVEAGLPRLLLGSPDELLMDTAESYYQEAFGHEFHLFRADFDNDGREDSLDAPASAASPDTARILLQTSAGRFESVDVPSAMGTGSPVRFASGDFDGDGRDEAVISASGSPLGALQLIDLATNGATASTPVLPGVAIQQMLVADLNADGRDDLVIDGGPSQLTIALSNPGGGFSIVPGALPNLDLTLLPSGLSDLNQDGSPDLVARQAQLPGDLLIFFNNGLGVFSPPMAVSVSGAVAVGDIDVDGDVDILSATGDLQQNDGTGAFQTTTAIPELSTVSGINELTLTDLDADGDLDVFAVAFPSVPHIFFNLGDGTFETRPSQLNGLPTSNLFLRSAVDLDQDGDADLAPAAGLGLADLNRSIDIRAPWLARLGQSFRIELASQPGFSDAATLAFAAIGFSQLPQPLSIGIPGFQIDNPILLPAVTLPAPFGEASLSFSIDNNPALVGLEFVHQAIFLRLLPGGTFELAVTAVLEESIRR